MYDRIYTEDWDFRGVDTKKLTHCYHSYPAMMIPQIARKLIKEYAPKNTKLIFDPYMGSGTTLVEASVLGIDSLGTDINPLARLIAEVKTTEYKVELIESYFTQLKDRIELFDSSILKYSYEDFPNITRPHFWYSLEVLNKLQYLTEEIKKIPTKEKVFFQLILSEVIRESSYTRNGEFKRYRMEKDKIKTFSVNPFDLFKSKYGRNLKGLIKYNEIKNKGTVSITDINTVYDISHKLLKDKSVDLIVTSPPYGDSRTTVAYGQFSRWANEWFLFENAKNLDSHLMGGKVKKHKESCELEVSSIRSELSQIKSKDEKRYKEVIAFLEDYKKSIENVSSVVRDGGVVCYVVGNRTVKGIQIPLDYFTVEMFEKNGFNHLETLVRTIPNKRMPSKTSPTNKKGKNVGTMTNEYIVVLNKIKGK